VNLKTNSRELADAINSINVGADIGKVDDGLRAPLASAFAALARLIDTSGSDVTLLADVSADAVTLSIATGKASDVADPEAPWDNPHLAQIDQERQAAKRQADGAEAERIRTLLEQPA
jgi:hypothetical protein